MPPKPRKTKRVQSDTVVVGFGNLDPKYGECDFCNNFRGIYCYILVCTDVYSNIK